MRIFLYFLWSLSLFESVKVRHLVHRLAFFNNLLKPLLEHLIYLIFSLILLHSFITSRNMIQVPWSKLTSQTPLAAPLQKRLNYDLPDGIRWGIIEYNFNLLLRYELRSYNIINQLILRFDFILRKSYYVILLGFETRVFSRRIRLQFI